MVLIPDTSITDGVAHNLCQQINSPFPILLLSRVDELNFNEQILSLAGKPYICIDYIENGWNWDRQETLIVGENTDRFKFLKGEGWRKVHDFMSKNKPLVYFKRELLKKDATNSIVPIQYPCFLPPFPVQTKEEFDNRIFQVINAWGLSHEYRKTLHGNIWREAGRHGYSVCDNIYYIDAFVSNETNKNKWLTMNIPHYSRQPMDTFIQINGLARISISLPGAGVVCFRHSESPINSVMLMQEDELAWSIEWEHNVNCIKSAPGMEIETAIIALNKQNLYDIYRAGVETIDKYRVARYCKEYIENISNKA